MLRRVYRPRFSAMEAENKIPRRFAPRNDNLLLRGAAMNAYLEETGISFVISNECERSGICELRREGPETDDG